VYVSFSGGKDSTVLKHIVDQMYDDIPAVFVNTGLEYPEIQTFVREVKAGKYPCFNPDVEIIRPEMRFDEVIQLRGFPVVSKIVSKRVEEARNAIASGKADAVCVQQIQGRYMTPSGTEAHTTMGNGHFCWMRLSRSPISAATS
jgi:7-cyano-7-deazaguanine synthase in queuosine biosynthesis